MDQNSLVEQQLRDGERIVEQLRHHGIEVAVACWVKATEDNRWFLYIASPIVDDRGLHGAYRAVFDVMRGLPNLWVDSLDVKLVSASHPIVQDALGIYRQYPALIPTRYAGLQLGGIGIEEAYIYPPATAATP